MVKANRVTLTEVKAPLQVAEVVITREQRLGRAHFAIIDAEQRMHEVLRNACSEHQDADIIVTTSVVER